MKGDHRMRVPGTLVAVMVMLCDDLIEEGAVYNPPDRVPDTGVMDQVTPALPAPVTVAVN